MQYVWFGPKFRTFVSDFVGGEGVTRMRLLSDSGNLAGYFQVMSVHAGYHDVG